jgi:hypothetical protein
MTPDGVLSVTTPSGVTRTSRPPGMRPRARPLGIRAMLRIPPDQRPQPDDDGEPPPF